MINIYKSMVNQDVNYDINPLKKKNYHINVHVIVDAFILQLARKLY